jgi:endonuclease/exonuclease/phosphatase family metal-dependent hydrolase
MSKSGFGGRMWCIVGDFNAVRSSDERRGVSLLSPNSYSVEMRDFNRFIERMEVEDINLVGGKFTWFHSNGIAMSRIDRMMVSEDWLAKWGILSLRILPRDVSDHCPLVLKRCVIETIDPNRFVFATIGSFIEIL